MVDVNKIKFCIEHSKRAPMDICLEHFGLRQPAEHFDKFFETCPAFFKQLAIVYSWEVFLRERRQDSTTVAGLQNLVVTSSLSVA